MEFSNIRNNKMTTVIGIVILLFFSIFVIPFIEACQKDGIVGFQFLIIAIMSIVFLFKENEKHAFSLTVSFFFFCYMFFFCAGTYQFVNDSYPWGCTPSLDDILLGNWLIIFGIFSFAIGHLFKFKVTYSKTEYIINYVVRKKGLFILFLVVLAFVIRLFMMNSLADFFSRDTFNIGGYGSQQAATLILQSVSNGASLLFALAAVTLLKQKRTFFSIGVFLLSMMLVLFAVPPLGSARFLAGAVYGTLVLYGFPSLRRGRKFLVLMFVFMLLLFPFLNNFRHINDGDIISLFDIADGLSKNLQQGDFDAYTMLLFTIQHVESFGYSYGYQLLGPITFWIPRSLWPDKPWGTGYTIFSNLGELFTNVSAPFVAEFYINFGILGVIFLCFLVGILFHTIDDVYWINKGQGFLSLIYPFIALLVIFICRGDLMSSISFMLGVVLSGYIFYKIAFKKYIGNK